MKAYQAEEGRNFFEIFKQYVHVIQGVAEVTEAISSGYNNNNFPAVIDENVLN